MREKREDFVSSFKMVADFKPLGDQPKAINQLTSNLKKGIKNQVLLGVTGSGKTATMSWAIEKIQKPTLVISPNKTLAAQLYQEFQEFFPENTVHYFVSYYDYYQPEAYIPQRDIYIEKDAKINREIDRLRHAAVQNLITRDDIIVVASVSCIYNLGSPKNYQKTSLKIKRGQRIKRRRLISHLTSLQYQRNDVELSPGTFRVRGEVVDVHLVTAKETLRIEFSGNRIERLEIAEAPLNLKHKEVGGSYCLFPAYFWVTPSERLKMSLENIKLELQEQLKRLRKKDKLLEAQRLEQRTSYDLEMLRETGFCHGIENYSRHLEFREPYQPPYTLLDYFSQDKSGAPRKFLVFIDESHQTLPQLHAMAIQDRVRKETLIKHGFRLPSALDNRPLTFEEFEGKTGSVIYVSATPGKEETKKSKNYVVEQLVRPTGLLEPSVEIRPTKNQVEDLISEIRKRANKNQRTLALTLTKRLAEALSDYLEEKGISCCWLHSEVKTLKRPQVIQNLRLGKYDVLVGINLLREGLDLPEVTLVAILDADKEGFLRSRTTLIQTMGRAARHTEGHVILYADQVTGSIKSAIEEIKRRRKIQEKYNKTHHIIPRPIIKKVKKWSLGETKREVETEFWAIRDRKLLEKEMKKAAENLNFERAAEIRDLIKEIK